MTSALCNPPLFPVSHRRVSSSLFLVERVECRFERSLNCSQFLLQDLLFCFQCLDDFHHAPPFTHGCGEYSALIC